MTLGVFDRGIEVMTQFGFQILVALDNPDSRHVEIVIFLLEPGRPETHTVTGTQIHAANWLVTCRQLGCHTMLVAIAEIVVAHCSHNLPFLIDSPVELSEEVERILLTLTTREVAVHQIIVHIVTAQ